jgi:hypothetical protein
MAGPKLWNDARPIVEHAQMQLKGTSFDELHMFP